MKCRRCAEPLPERAGVGRPRVYCGPACARGAASARLCNGCGIEFNGGSARGSRYLLCKACRPATASRSCRKCGATFMVDGPARNRQYCSNECRPNPTKAATSSLTCDGCGFVLTRTGARGLIARACPSCSQPFPLGPGGRYSRAAQRAYVLKCTYGLSVERYAAMLAAQDGACALSTCDEPCEVVDHCHVTFLIRGLLCHRHNRGIGFFHDDPAALRAAADYLENRAAFIEPEWDDRQRRRQLVNAARRANT